jgi:hypothetical protein
MIFSLKKCISMFSDTTYNAPAVKPQKKNYSEPALRTSTRKRKASQKALEADVSAIKRDVSAIKRVSKTLKRPLNEESPVTKSNSGDVQRSCMAKPSVARTGSAGKDEKSPSGGRKRGRPIKNEAGKSVRASADPAMREMHILTEPVGKALAVMREVWLLCKTC